MAQQTIGDRIVAARDSMQLSTAQLARRLGVATKTMAAWEAGQTEPRSNRVMNLAGILGVSPTWLLAGDGAATQRPIQGDELSRIKTEVDQARDAMAQHLEALDRISQRLQDLENAG